jgi:hypothetical protein
MEQIQKGFFGALFDFSFKEFVTTKLIKILYVLGMIGIIIGSLGMIFGGISQGGSAAFMGLIGGLLFFLLAMIWLRVSLELIIVIFRINENVARIAGQEAEQPPAPPASPQGPQA